MTQAPMSNSPGKAGRVLRWALPCLAGALLALVADSDRMNVAIGVTYLFGLVIIGVGTFVRVYRGKDTPVVIDWLSILLILQMFLSLAAYVVTLLLLGKGHIV